MTVLAEERKNARERDFESTKLGPITAMPTLVAVARASAAPAAMFGATVGEMISLDIDHFDGAYSRRVLRLLRGMRLQFYTMDIGLIMSLSVAKSFC